MGVVRGTQSNCFIQGTKNPCDVHRFEEDAVPVNLQLTVVVCNFDWNKLPVGSRASKNINGPKILISQECGIASQRAQQDTIGVQSIGEERVETVARVHQVLCLKRPLLPQVLGNDVRIAAVY